MTGLRHTYRDDESFSTNDHEHGAAGLGDAQRAAIFAKMKGGGAAHAPSAGGSAPKAPHPSPSAGHPPKASHAPPGGHAPKAPHAPSPHKSGGHSGHSGKMAHLGKIAMSAKKAVSEAKKEVMKGAVAASGTEPVLKSVEASARKHKFGHAMVGLTHSYNGEHPFSYGGFAGGFAHGAGEGESGFTPPAGARAAAKRGLEARKEHGRGGLDTKQASKQGIGSGVARASSLANGKSLSYSTVKRMKAYFDRHEVDKKGKDWGNKSSPSAGKIAWDLWGGDAGRAWANKIVRQEEGE